MPRDTSPAPETIKLIAELLEGELEVPKGVVQIYNQTRRITPIKGLFVTVSIVGDRPYGLNTRYEAREGSIDLEEVATMNVQEIISIDLFSADDSARTRRNAVLFALASVRSQQLQDKYAFKISNLPASFVDLSEVDASKRLNRYAATFNVLRAYDRRMLVPTFTNFTIPPPTLLVNP